MIQTLVLRFEIAGLLVWLSHRETANVLQRALVRAGVRMSYTEGFNPHPRLSLPLPRSVGLASADEMLCVQITDRETRAADVLADAVGGQVPDGCRIYGAELAWGRVAFEATAAEYEITVESDVAFGRMAQAAGRLQEHLAAREPVHVLRGGPSRAGVKVLDVAPFLECVRWAEDRAVARCRITPQGTVRMDELLRLLDLTCGDLAGPIVRRSVQWTRKGPVRNNG